MFRSVSDVIKPDVYILACVSLQDQSSVNDIDVMLKETRGLLVSTFKYLLKAPPSKTAFAGQGTIQKVSKI